MMGDFLCTSTNNNICSQADMKPRLFIILLLSAFIYKCGILDPDDKNENLSLSLCYIKWIDQNWEIVLNIR